MSHLHEEIKRQFDSVINSSAFQLHEFFGLPKSANFETAYLQEVCNYSVDKLSRSIVSLESEYNGLTTSVKADSFLDDRNVILPSIDSINVTISRDVKNLQARLSAISSSDWMLMPESNVREDRLLSGLMSNYSSIVDLLEIPSLMEACVRNGRYSEAISLHAHVLGYSDRSKLRIFSILIKQAQDVFDKIVKHVSDSLSEKSGLSVSEAQNLLLIHRLLYPKTEKMNLVFLNLRSRWFSKLRQSLVSAPATSHKLINTYAELIRVHLHAFWKLYTSLFPNCETDTDRFIHAEIGLFEKCLDSHLPKIIASPFAYEIFAVCSDMCETLVQMKFYIFPYFAKKFTNEFEKWITNNKNDQILILNQIRLFPLLSLLPVIQELGIISNPDFQKYLEKIYPDAFSKGVTGSTQQLAANSPSGTTQHVSAPMAANSPSGAEQHVSTSMAASPPSGSTSHVSSTVAANSLSGAAQHVSASLGANSPSGSTHHASAPLAANSPLGSTSRVSAPVAANSPSESARLAPIIDVAESVSPPTEEEMSEVVLD